MSDIIILGTTRKVDLHGMTLRNIFPYSVDPNDQKKTACYDIDVEVDDPLKNQMSGFLLSTANQQEIALLDNKVPRFLSAVWQK